MSSKTKSPPIAHAVGVLKAHYRQWTKEKVYRTPEGTEIDPAVKMAWGASVEHPNHKDVPLSYKQIILKADPGDVLDDGIIREHFGCPLHVSER